MKMISRAAIFGSIVGLLFAIGGWIVLEHLINGALRYQADAALAAEASVVSHGFVANFGNAASLLFDPAGRPTTTAPDAPAWSLPTTPPPIATNKINWDTPSVPADSHYAGYRAVFLPVEGGTLAYGKPDGFYSDRLLHWRIGLAGFTLLCGAWVGGVIYVISGRLGRWASVGFAARPV